MIVHPPQRGFIRGSDLLTIVVGLEAAVAGFLHDDEPKPAVVLLDIAAAFPSADCEYIRWALPALRAPAAVVDVLVALYGSTHLEVSLNWRAIRRHLRLTRGSRQGCLASGNVRELLYEPNLRCMWLALPRDEVRPTVFADAVTVLLRNVFRDLRILHCFMEGVRSGTGARTRAR